MFDITKKNYSATAEVGYEHTVTLPGTDEPTDWKITIRGSESKTVKKFQRDTYKERKQKESMAARQGKIHEDSLEEIEKFGIDNAVIRVIGWTGFGRDGVEVPFTEENAREVFKEHGWVRDQVIEVSTNIFNFRPQ